MEKYTDYILEQLQKLLSIDSPTGYTKNVTDYLMDEYKAMGYTREFDSCKINNPIQSLME